MVERKRCSIAGASGSASGSGAISMLVFFFAMEARVRGFVVVGKKSYSVSPGFKVSYFGEFPGYFSVPLA